MIGSIVSQLTTGEGAKSFDRYGVGAYYMDHANAVYPSNACLLYTSDAADEL